MDEPYGAIIGLFVAVGLALLLALLLASNFLIPSSVTGQIINSTQYDAGTIQDGTTYHVIGYNLTYSYHNLIGHEQVLCPLYPVGSKVSIGYADMFWLWPTIFGINDLPQGCQTGPST